MFVIVICLVLFMYGELCPDNILVVGESPSVLL